VAWSAWRLLLDQLPLDQVVEVATDSRLREPVRSGVRSNTC